MRDRPLLQKAARFFKFIYLKLFRINDSPERVAAGLAAGIFLGVFPGTGPFAALAAAFIFRINRAAALIGSILTNTWLSIPVFLVALKAGTALTGLDYRTVQTEWHSLIMDFHWSGLADMSIWRIAGPVLAGYIFVSLCIGVIAYVVALVLLRHFRRDG